MPFMRRAFSISVKCLVSLEKCGYSKDIDVLWGVIFVICMIYGSIRDMKVKDSKNMRL